MIVREKNGYTVQHLDVWGIIDGVEKIVVPNVGQGGSSEVLVPQVSGAFHREGKFRAKG
jgi:hypothetical protein